MNASRIVTLLYLAVGTAATVVSALALAPGATCGAAGYFGCWLAVWLREVRR